MHTKIFLKVVNTMAGEAISIKGTRNGLVIIFDPDHDIEEIKSSLKSKMENSRGFFKGAKVSLYNHGSDTDHSYTHELEGICRQYGLIPSQEVSWPPSAGGDSQGESTPAKKKRTQVIPIRQQAHPGGEPALLVTRTLRSGHRISSRKSVIIMGDVNPGAEVVSEGSVYVLGSCKGNIQAGSGGNIMAEVFALKLQPVVLRIGAITADTAIFSGHTDSRVARVNLGKIILAKM